MGTLLKKGKSATQKQVPSIHDTTWYQSQSEKIEKLKAIAYHYPEGNVEKRKIQEEIDELESLQRKEG